jgi:hypothetical protein
VSRSLSFAAKARTAALALASLLALAFAPGRVEAAAPPASEPAEARVAAVAVELTIWRGRVQPPGGEPGPPGGARVDGVARYELTAPARGGERLWLLDFAEGLVREPLELDEVELAGYVAGPFRPGRLELERVDGDMPGIEVERLGERRDVVLVLPAGTRRVTLRYRVDIPDRYWPLGCVRQRCSLSGAIAPLPSEPARGGSFLPPGGRVVVPARWSVEARLGAGASERDEVVIADRGPVVGAPVAYPSVFFGRRWHHLRMIHHGVEIEILGDVPRAADRYPEERPGQLRRDHAGRLAAIATEAVETAEFVGAPLAPDGRILVVQGPLRSRLAESHPTAVLVSDEFGELFPWKRFTKFHEVAAARAMLETFAHGWFAGRHDASTDLWLAGTVGFALMQVWQQRREHRDEYAQDLLRNLTFVPAVDRFLYTGQASFSDAYFRGGEDHVPLRNHPLSFANELPTGRRIHEKLDDLLSPPALAGFYAAVLADRDQDPRTAAEAAYGHRLGWFFDQWLGPYPAVDYAIGQVRSSRTGSGWQHEIEVVRDAERPVIEPVQVLVEERGGRAHYLIWNGDPVEGDAVERDGELVRHRFVLETTRPIARVRVDPRWRLTETSRHPPRPGARGDNADPRFNDRRPPDGRFLYTGVGGSLAVSEFLAASTPITRFNALSFFAAFEGSLQRDMRRTGSIVISKGRESILSAGGGASFYFGAPRNKQRRRVRLYGGMTGTLLSADSLDPVGGFRLQETLTLSDETRRFVWWPERGRRWWAAVTASHTLRIDRDRRDDRHALSFAAGWEQLWRIAKDHVVATRLEADVTAPIASAPEFRSLARAGGIEGLNGFLADELFGLSVALAQVEYRHVYLNDMSLNFLHLWWMRSIGGVAFVGGATRSACESYAGWFGPGSYSAQVGYGLMAYLQVLGVTPQIVRLDAAVPLGRRASTCLGRELPGYLAEYQGLPAADARRLLPPVTFNLTFNHPF